MSISAADKLFYAFYGAAICGNLQGFTLSYVLLKKDYKRNSFVIIANIAYFICNILYTQNQSSCQSTAYLIKTFQLLGSILEVMTPFTRALKLMSRNLKVVSAVLSIGLLFFSFIQLNQLKYTCNITTNEFINFEPNLPAILISAVFSVSIYLIAFLTILKVVYASQFLKLNARLQIVKLVSIYTMLFAISTRIAITILSIIARGDDGIQLALQSHLILSLLLSQFAVEVTKKIQPKQKETPGQNA